MFRALYPLVALALAFAVRSIHADPAPAVDKPPGAGKKLYHVVSVKFKDDATKEQIGEVEKAFRALKEQVPVVRSLDWGTNVSPEHRNKGFTHCFVLTFASEADRDTYINHDMHKAFGKILGPVRDDVMVIDFWDQPAPAASATGVGGEVNAKLYHVVSLKFKDAATKEQVEEASAAFAALQTKVPNVINLDWGTNLSPEKRNKGFTHCFVLRFPTDGDRDVYLTHDAHKAFGKLLGPVLDDVTVIDFWAEH